jgi:hypothetical protein
MNGADQRSPEKNDVLQGLPLPSELAQRDWLH